MSDKQPIYKFKWSNYTLERYIEQRQCKADKLRRDAEILIKKADQIDEERRDLETALLPAEPPPGPRPLAPAGEAGP